MWRGEGLGVRRFLLYVEALPANSLTKAQAAGAASPEELWTVERELMAQLVELASVQASPRHGIRKPVEVPRPDHVTRSQRRSEALPPGEAAAAMMGRRLRVVR